MTERTHPLPPPRALLFDLDGTLIDTWRLYVESFRRALTPYLGHVPTDEEMFAHRPRTERSFLLGWLGAEDGERAHADFGRHYAELFPALCDGVYDGTREMLAALRGAGYPLGIVTGKGRHAWETTEAAVALGPFDVVVTEDDVAAAKPDPEGLLLAARTLGLPPGEIVYVGDSHGDLAAGRAAAMQTAAVLWPKTGAGEAEHFLKKAGGLVDRVFATPAELTRVFANWC